MQKNTSILLLTVMAALFISPLIMNPHAEFGGADGAAGELIEETGYEPWFSPIWEPPSGEIESLLFVTQAAIGATVIGYFIGFEKGKRNESSES